MTKQSVLVTGASIGGIGAALVLAFQQRGLLVFAAVRNPEKAGDLADLEDVHVLILDVTDAKSVKAAVERVEGVTDGRGLDYLVNNCGVSHTMPLVDCTLDEGKKLFDVNLWGMLAMVKAFTPQLSKTKGTVVNISSIAGLLYLPWAGLYSASKAALNVMTDTLRLELAPLGITVLNIMSGAVKSNLFTNQDEFKLPDNSLYAPIESTIADSAKGTAITVMQDADVFAMQVVADILSGTRGTVYRGSSANILTRIISRVTPTFILDAMLSAGRGLDELAKSIKSQS